MTLAVIIDEVPVEVVDGADVPVVIHTVPPDVGRAPYGAVMSWTEEQRNDAGVYTVIDGAITYGQKLGPMTVVVDGVGNIMVTRSAVPLVGDELAADIAARKAAMKADVMNIRETKYNGGVMFDGHEFQTRPQDRENISGARQLAERYLSGIGNPNNPRWHGGPTDYVWIDKADQFVPMTAPVLLNFGTAVGEQKTHCIFHAFGLKQQIDAAPDHAALDAIHINDGWEYVHIDVSLPS